MRRFGLWGLATLAVWLWTPFLVQGQETVREPSTKVEFPAEVTVTYDDTSYTLVATGTAVRKKLMFKVYGMVHYMQEPPQGGKDEILSEVLSDGKAKQLVLQFVRNVGADKIQNAWRDGFKKNTSVEQFSDIEPLVEQFVGYFTDEVRKGEQYIFRWLPGGTVVTIIKGEEKPAITSVEFARGLWAIWFGQKPAVKRDHLIRLLTEKS
jgi:hypothetical protein